MKQEEVFRHYVEDEISRSGSNNEQQAFIRSLSPGEFCGVCKRLSEERGNHVFCFIQSHPGEWGEISVDIANIKMNEINRNVNLLLKYWGFSLGPCSQDQRIRDSGEFRFTGEKPTRLVFIAESIGIGHYRLQDGNHRAIRLAWEGVQRFTLLVPSR
jgi:hypothetical protein